VRRNRPSCRAFVAPSCGELPAPGGSVLTTAGLGNKGSLVRAHQYQALGWRIIPAGHGPDHKRPCVKSWSAYRTRTPIDVELEAWFGNGTRNFPAVILGEPSGGLACRDFDVTDSYFAWTLDHSDLAAALPTVETGRGFHVYFKLDGEHFANCGDGELRGDQGHYCLLPPAIHHSGKVYKWLVEPTLENLRTFTLAEVRGCGLLPRDNRKSQRTATEETEETEGHSSASSVSVGAASSVSSVSVAGVSVVDLKAIEDAIRTTVAAEAGQRNTRIFKFARKLKAIASLYDAHGPELQGLVRQWWERSLPRIRTKDFIDTYGDFLRAWEAVRVPANEAFMDTIIERARKNPVQTGHDEAQDILAAMCRELQATAGDEPFYLSVRGAAEPFGQDQTWGGRRLKVLEVEGYIKCITRGSPLTQKATRWRYTEPAKKDPT